MRKLVVCAVVVMLLCMLVQPAFSVPGQMIFSGCNPMRQSPGLYIADPDGTDPVRLLWAAPPGEWNCLSTPDWSPDGLNMVLSYQCQLAVLPSCCTLPWPGDAPREPQIIWSCGRNPKWSPSGDRIAFFSGDGLALINPDGGEYRVLAPQTDWALALTWSADGSSIIYGGANAGLYDLWQVSGLDDPTPTVVQFTNTPTVTEMTPAVSPDGSELAYSEGPAVADRSWQDPLPPAGVRVASYPSMTAVRVLTDDPSYCDRVSAWSPDGAYVYFVREDATSTPRDMRLWRVRADGSAPEEPVPGLTGWDSFVGGPSFLRSGVYTSVTYALPGYAGIPVSVGVVGAQSLAGFQIDLRFSRCCIALETIDSCLPGPMIAPWVFLGPTIDQLAGSVKALAYAADPGAENVSGSGELLNLAVSTCIYEEAGLEDALSIASYHDLQLSDDWGDPIQMSALQGGIALKPLSSLQFSEVPAAPWADYNYAEPFSVTISARGDVGEILPWFGREVDLFVEMPDPDYGYPTLFRDLVSPTSVAMVDGVWTGDVRILGPVQAPACLLARYKDWGGRSNAFAVLVKGDVNGDGTVNVFDVIKVANIAIERGTWTDSERWAADLNGDGQVDIFDVVMCANKALEEMHSMSLAPSSAALAAPPSEPVVVTTDLTTTGTQAVLAVKLSNCAGLAGIQVDVQYDARKLAYRGLSGGALLSGVRSWTVMGNDLDGRAKAVAYTASADVLPGGEGTILTFTFNTSGKGRPKVDVTSVKLAAADGSEIACQMGVSRSGGKGKSR